MAGAETIDPLASERLAAIASSVCSPFSDHESGTHSMEYECIAKTIGERVASGVVFYDAEPIANPVDLRDAVTATASSMFYVDNPNYFRFLSDEVAVAYAMHVYQVCVDEVAR